MRGAHGATPLLLRSRRRTTAGCRALVSCTLATAVAAASIAVFVAETRRGTWCSSRRLAFAGSWVRGGARRETTARGSRLARHAVVPSPWEVLKLARDSTDDEIKKRYRQLAVEWHPDRHPDDPQAAAKFAEISRAYATLKVRLPGSLKAAKTKKKEVYREYSENPFEAAQVAVVEEPRIKSRDIWPEDDMVNTFWAKQEVRKTPDPFADLDIGEAFKGQSYEHTCSDLPLGSPVLIVDQGKQYPAFDSLAADFGLQSYISGQLLYNDLTMIVIGSKPYQNTGTCILVLKDEHGVEYLMADVGVA